MSEALVQEVAAPYALELEDVDVVYRVRGTDRQVIRGVTLNVERGEAYGLVGESGCGKSTVALAIVNYLPRNGRVRSGAIRIAGRDAMSLSGSELRKLRSSAVSMLVAVKWSDLSNAASPRSSRLPHARCSTAAALCIWSRSSSIAM